MRRWWPYLLLLAALVIALMSWASPDDIPLQEDPDGNHYGWDQDHNPHNGGSPDPVPAPEPAPMPVEGASRASVYTSDYYVGNGPVTLSGHALRDSLGADLSRR